MHEAESGDGKEVQNRIAVWKKRETVVLDLLLPRKKKEGELKLVQKLPNSFHIQDSTCTQFLDFQSSFWMTDSITKAYEPI